MSRADLRAWLLAALAISTSWGCAEQIDADRPATTATPLGSSQASSSPVPDFHRYMLGDLPAPDTGGRDPFGQGPAPTPVAPAPPRPAYEPALRGIVRADGRLVALFDRGSAALGESVHGWKVVEIDIRSVVLARGERRLRRSL